MAATATAREQVLALLRDGPARLDDDTAWDVGGTNKNGVTYLTRSGKPGFDATKGVKLRATLPPLPEAEWRKAAAKRLKERAKAAAKAAKAAKAGGVAADPDPVVADPQPPTLMQGLVFLLWDDSTFEVFTRDPMIESVTLLERIEGLAPPDDRSGVMDAAVCIEKDSLPWPMANREFVSLYALHESDDGRELFMLSVPTEHALAPAPTGDKVVRGQAETVTRLRELEDGRVQADMEVWYDMGGSVPKALMNGLVSMFTNYPMDMRAAVGELGVTKAAAEASAAERRARTRPHGEPADDGASGGAGVGAADAAAASASAGAGSGVAAAPAPGSTTDATAAPGAAAAAAAAATTTTDAPVAAASSSMAARGGVDAAGTASPEAVVVDGVAPAATAL